VILKLDYYEAGWQISFSGNKGLTDLQKELHMTDSQMNNFEKFMEDYDFNGVINAIKIAERKDVVDERKDMYVGCKIVDFVKKGSSIHVVLDNGESFPYGDFLQFRGHLNL
jgi:hypothetical protein